MIRKAKTIFKINRKRAGKKEGNGYYYASYIILKTTYWFLFLPVYSYEEITDIKVD